MYETCVVVGDRARDVANGGKFLPKRMRNVQFGDGVLQPRWKVKDLGEHVGGSNQGVKTGKSEKTDEERRGSGGREGM